MESFKSLLSSAGFSYRTFINWNRLKYNRECLTKESLILVESGLTPKELDLALGDYLLATKAVSYAEPAYGQVTWEVALKTVARSHRRQAELDGVKYIDLFGGYLTNSDLIGNEMGIPGMYWVKSSDSIFKAFKDALDLSRLDSITLQGDTYYHVSRLIIELRESYKAIFGVIEGIQLREIIRANLKLAQERLAAS